MRKVLFAIICITLSACGKSTPEAAAVPPAPAAADPATTETPAAAPAPTPDAASAATPDAAPAATPDAAPATPDAAPTTPDAAPAAALDAATDGGAVVAFKFEPTAPPKPFHDMTEREQKDHMKKVVIPVMRERLQAFDAEEFAKVNCATCHGPGAIEGKFEMPNSELFKLPKTREGFEKLAAEKPEAMKFMKDTVMPAMATMLGEALYDPATSKGFGCMGCHTAE